ncbi:MBT domain-containing protein 1-like isoform X3 [Portunus trituberculatus]|uniref:MBT domain-containing protein 1-like isoform X3 n=1 Tax=Portunus trituberculatus TaxID=210409 RepID=UPI001E1CC2C6|nr:MBT domain-containing protein 1-like isoform X3 [Portunus trituberculatus]
MMASQDDLGMLWYGVTGVSFNPADPAEVMLNTGTTAPLLSDHPRPLVPTPVPYTEPSTTQHTQMLYDPNTGDYVSQPEYMYEAYDGYDEDSSSSQVMQQQGTPPITEPGMVEHPDESPPPMPKSKKPKVHQHPALKLKTPIAYQKDTDLSAIPIMREGMAVCEKCGAIGVKHAFYGKERKFCSLSCARGPLPPSQALAVARQMEKEVPEEPAKVVLPTPEQIVNQVPPLSPEVLPQGGSTITKPSQVVQPQPVTVPQETLSSPTYLPPSESTVDLEGTFSWASSYLDDSNFKAVPVSCFKHAPMAECWDQMSAGMKVEVGCGEEGVTKDAYWVATVIAIGGFKAKLRFEGFVEDSSKDFWVDLCSEEVHPVGWCATQGRPLIPPRSIQHKYKDWKEFLMRRLTGARTLPTNFVSRVVESQKSRFRPGLNLEVVDKNRIAQMRVATVTEVVGKRLHLRYHGAPPDDNGFWCHEDAPIIHPVGWSREVGHEIVASQSYHEKCIRGTYDPNDAPPELFVATPLPAYLRNAKTTFAEGMKLEAIDPLNLSAICVATIMKVLHNNYLMIRIDSYESDDTCSDWFCYHATSPCIFPAGFCEMHNIPLTPPRGYEGQFSWFTYLKKTQATAAPPSLFNREVPTHGFEEGMALESADLMDPRLVCVATVKQVKGRLLKVHFDGWESDFDQWIDYQSPDIYPVGWCDMSGYRLEGPKSEVLCTSLTVLTPQVPKRKPKGGWKYGKPGRRGRPMGNKKLGKVGSGSMNTNGNSALAQKRRGRPPKERNQGETGYDESPTPHIKPIENENSDFLPIEEESSSAPRVHRSHNKKDARRSPRAASTLSTTASNTKTLPVRSTRARTLTGSYNQSDEEDISDETSSGVASLDGNESSGEAWDVDEKSCNPSSAASSTPPSSLPGDLSNASFTPSSVSETKMGNFTSHPIQFDQPSAEDNTCYSNASPNLQSRIEPMRNVRNVCSNSTIQQVAQTVNESSTVKGSATQTVPFTTSIKASTSGNPRDLIKSQVPGQLSSQKNGSLQQDKTTSQSPVVTSTVTQQVSTNPQVSLVSATQSESETKYFIPRLIDGPVKDGSKVRPKLWTPQDVAEFLKTNDCGAYCDNFISQNIHGSKLLTLSQNEVMGLTGMKVGPSLKIHDLVQQLLALVNPAQARYQATLMKRGLSFT